MNYDPDKDEELYENLVKRHPDLMKKAQIGDSLGVGPGWYNILDVLCGLISNRVQNLRSSLNYAMEKNKDNILELEGKLATALEELPTIVQVKEKFGGLRFYIDGGTDEIHNYISFAEGMSYRTCEQCGNVGKTRQGGWVKVLCDEHYLEEHPEEAAKFAAKKPGPKLAEESFEE